MQKTENSRYFQAFQKFASLQLQNYTHNTCSCREQKTYVTFKIQQFSYYNTRTTHNTFHSGNGKLTLLSTISAILFVTTPKLHIIHVHAGNRKLTLLSKFQQFSSHTLNNSLHYNYRTTHDTCSCRKRKTHVTFYNYSNSLHYNSRTTHNTCVSRKRKTHVTLKNFNNSLHYNSSIYYT